MNNAMDDTIHQALSNMFADKRFSPNGHYLWKANINDKRLGVVVGTKDARFANYALGKNGYNRVINGKEKNSIDLGIVVFADVDNAGVFHFVSAYDAVELQPRLEAVLTRTSDYGAFWVLTPSWVRGDFDGGDAW